MGSPILPVLRVLSALPAVPRLRRQESSLSLQQYFQYDTLQQKLKCLEEENQKLRMEVSRAGWWDTPLCTHLFPSWPLRRLEVLPTALSPSDTLSQATNIAAKTCQYEDQEQQLMIDCVEQFCTWGWARGGQLLSGLGLGGSAGTAQHHCMGWGWGAMPWR